MNRKLVGAMMGLLAAVSFAWAGDTGRTTLDLSGGGWKLWRDKDAQWRKDQLYLRHEPSGLFKRSDDPAIADPAQPGTLEIGQLPVNPPTGGWDALDKHCEVEVSVPGTLEEYLWGKDGNPLDENGKYFGVSWWWREFTLPSVPPGHRVILQCASTRARGEIYIDGKLCGYDVVGNTPYEFDVTTFVQGGGKHRIAFRITNPGGDFGWCDNPNLKWGDTEIRINNSHGFGGITGPLTLAIVAPVSISELWVRNTPAPREIIPTITLANTSGRKARREIEVVVRDAASGTVAATAKRTVKLPPGATEVTLPVTAAEARLWSPETPNLYVCSVSLKEKGAVTDRVEKRFGFRWFDVRGLGSDAQFMLNGKRFRILSAISWGHWPQSNLIATPELAAKQVAMAKTLGLNCLTHHRTIGDPKTLDEADRQGLFYFEEAGGCEGNKSDLFGYVMNREKFLRMVKRDRSHPSTFHFNMANEAGPMPGPVQLNTMMDAHQLDPTRSITWSSGGVMGYYGDNTNKVWMKPLDQKVLHAGWWDEHHAGISDAYIDTLYNNPTNFHFRTTNTAEIVYWGESGPVGTPPRFQLLKDLCSKPGHRMGWDGADWLQRYDLVTQWLKESGMDRWFTVDSLTRTMGDKLYYFQGRMIENSKINDVTDGFVISGWENDKQNAMCGLVDLWRNPKTDNLDLIRAYTRPLYVAVKLREKVAHLGETAVADIWLVNEKNVCGEAELRVEVALPSKQVVALPARKVHVTGGDCYGELLHEGIPVPVDGAAGYYTVRAMLLQNGKEIARGGDQLLAVDWKTEALPARGALLETNGRLAKFFKERKGVEIPAYGDTLGKLDYVLVGQSVEPQAEKLLGAAGEVTLPDGSGPGLLAEYFNGKTMQDPVLRRVEPAVDCNWQKAWPDARLAATNYSVRWTGTLRVPEAGFYEFSLNRRETSQIVVGGKLILCNSRGPSFESVWLAAGNQSLQVHYFGKEALGQFQLRWHPQRQAAVRQLDSLVRRAKEDGTTVVFLNPVLVGDHLKYNDELVKRLVTNGVLARYDSILIAGPVWLGGSYIAGAGPLFEGLPDRTAFNWEYQLLANGPYCIQGRGIKREPTRANQMNIGLRIAGAETLVGAWTDFNADPNLKKPGTAVGVIPCGKGRIVLSTLDILPYLESERGAAHVVRKLLCNMTRIQGPVYQPGSTSSGPGDTVTPAAEKRSDAESWMRDSGMLDNGSIQLPQ